MSRQNITFGLAQFMRSILNKLIITRMFIVTLFIILLNITVGCRNLDKTPNTRGNKESTITSTSKAKDSIPAADALFSEAKALEPAKSIIRELNRKDRIRFQKYEQLIKDYPTSDKIDDAAFELGLILEELGDYMLALDYYMNAFKWNPETPYPARFKSAYMLDKHLHRYDEARKLYTEAIKLEGSNGKYKQWKELAEKRIVEIQKLGENK